MELRRDFGRIVRRCVLAMIAALPLVVAAPREAQAFCGFYVAPSDGPLYADATMVALMREGTRTALSMSNNYKGPAADFAMVVPVPVVLQKEDVKTLTHDVFHRLEALSAPRLVEYWEQDPCYEPPEEEENLKYDKKSSALKSPTSGGTGSDHGVTIEAKFTVGEYDVLVLGAKESDGLETWLTENGYKIPKGAAAALAPYVEQQQKFFVAKVDITKVKLDDKGVAVLSPLRFHYESADFRLPVRLGLMNSNGKQDLIVYVLSKESRYEVANYANAFIPTNLDVTDATRGSFGAFYAALFDATLDKAGGRAVVTEYSWMSNGCDPCPTPPLGDADIAALGGDALLGMAPPPGAADAGTGVTGDPMGGYYGSSTPMVLTRLHTRYSSATLTDDLVFKAAPAIVGGRELAVDPSGALEKGAVPSSMNNFQARYAIRHTWTGAITCEKPHRGVWGGPPNGGTAPPAAATGLAAQPRDGIQLASMIVSNAAELDLKKDAPAAGLAPPTPPTPPTPFPWSRVAVAVTLVAVLFGAAVFFTRKRT